MALSIKDPEADALARELAGEAGESITTAVTIALRERLGRLRARKGRQAAVERILFSAWSLPRLDARSPEDIIGYDDRGLPA
jgi:antitoxin VapB